MKLPAINDVMDRVTEVFQRQKPETGQLESNKAPQLKTEMSCTTSSKKLPLSLLTTELFG